MNGAGWRSYHLFRAEPWDEFLRDVVQPFVSQVMDEGLATQYFFIRYWERGPHIRLRLETAAPAELDARVHAHFEHFFRLAPSRRERERPGWLPNDTVQEIAYEPETLRYGGPARLLIAEEQFQASSCAVMALLSSGGWSHERALGAAIQLHLIFAYAVGFRFGALASFVSASADEWPRFLGITPENSLEPAFRAAFAGQRESLIAAHAAIWSALHDGAEFEQEWANRWLAAMRGIGMRLRAAGGNGGGAFDRQEESILKSYMHMTNNRLGLLLREEAYLAFLMSRCMEELSVLA